MAEPIITRKQLEDRLGKVTVQRIFDDNNDGVADDDPVTRLLRDASGKVRRKLGRIYPVDQLKADDANDDGIISVTLDVAVAYAAQRHQTIMKRDWEALMKHAERELEDVRKGLDGLGKDTSPEPASNVGGDVMPGSPATDEEPTKTFFLGGTGDF